MKRDIVSKVPSKAGQARVRQNKAGPAPVKGAAVVAASSGETSGEASRSLTPSVLDTLFGIDLRSLAIFRICIAIFILIDLLQRSTSLQAFYTDAGAVPRDIVRHGEWYPAELVSLHVLSGSLWFQALMFLVAGAFAVALLVGYRTQTATIVSYILLISLHGRNPLLLQGGDTLLRVLLFWSMMLPLGACYSLDRAMNSAERPPTRVLSVATAGVLLQIAFVYWFTAYFKMNPMWLRDQTAIIYALSVHRFIQPVGQYLLQYPELLKALTIPTIFWESLGPVLAFVPFKSGPIRTLVVLGFILFHIGLGLSLSLWLFSPISCAAWLLFLPTWFWDKVNATLARTKAGKMRLGIKIYYDGDCGFCKKMARVISTLFAIPEESVRVAQSDPAIYEHMQTHNSWVLVDPQGSRHIAFNAFAVLLRTVPILGWLSPLINWRPFAGGGNRGYRYIADNRGLFSSVTGFLQYRPLYATPTRTVQILASIALIYIGLYNLRTTKPPLLRKIWTASFNTPGRLLRVNQRWNMFDRPPKSGGWFIAAGTLENGSKIDLFRQGAPVSWDIPKPKSPIMRDLRWAKYLGRIRGAGGPYYQDGLARYLVNHWNQAHPAGQRVQRVQLYYMSQKTDLEKGSLPPKRVEFFSKRVF
jgi:predicted DCC family thiol-disulfide oxidoreductase YuxK